jgi:hypothetical protein
MNFALWSIVLKCSTGWRWIPWKLLPRRKSRRVVIVPLGPQLPSQFERTKGYSFMHLTRSPSCACDLLALTQSNLRSSQRLPRFRYKPTQGSVRSSPSPSSFPPFPPLPPPPVTLSSLSFFPPVFSWHSFQSLALTVFPRSDLRTCSTNNEDHRFHPLRPLLPCSPRAPPPRRGPRGCHPGHHQRSNLPGSHRRRTVHLRLPRPSDQRRQPRQGRQQHCHDLRTRRKACPLRRPCQPREQRRRALDGQRLQQLAPQHWFVSLVISS